MLQIDNSLLIQIINFLFLLFILNLLLYKPIRTIISKRKEEFSSLEKAIAEYQAKIEEETRLVQESEINARKEGFKEKEALKGKGLEEEKAILEQAMSQAGDKVKRAKEDIEAKMVEVKRALEDQVALFSKELAEKILGRSVQ